MTTRIPNRRKTAAIKVWLYISRPFQITRVLELLYMLNWMLYAVLSFLPEQYTGGSLFRILRAFFNQITISTIFVIIAFIHIYALIGNVIFLRKLTLLFNIGLLFYITTIALQATPFSAGIGYLIILIGVSIFSFWRMDETA